MHAAGHALTNGKFSTDDTLPAMYTSLSGIKNLKTGDTVLAGGTIYVFAAVNQLNVDLAAEDYGDPLR